MEKKLRFGNLDDIKEVRMITAKKWIDKHIEDIIDDLKIDHVGECGECGQSIDDCAGELRVTLCDVFKSQISFNAICSKCDFSFGATVKNWGSKKYTVEEGVQEYKVEDPKNQMKLFNE